MAIYEERLQRDLNHIRDRVLTVGEKVLQAYKNSVQAVLTCDHSLANQVILGDEPINNTIRKIDGLCHRFIAAHLPSGGHLRTISSIIRANLELERIGDYAVTISRESIQFAKPPTKKFASEIEQIADVSSRTLQMALEAFKQNNAELASTTKEMTRPVETGFESILKRLIDACERHPHRAEDMFRLMHVFTKLIRVADQACNICNEILFAVTGQQRPPRTYRIWFIDANHTLSKMAEAIARKLFPHSAEYLSFGIAPANTFDHSLIKFLLEKGIAITAERPQTFELTPQELQELGENYILVSVQGPIKDYIPSGHTLEHIPFRTVLLEWDVGAIPSGLNKEETQEHYEELYREIAYKIRELIQLFKGEEDI
jgi:phosphate transport system protein